MSYWFVPPGVMVGEIADESLATPETLGQVREKELRCARSKNWCV